MQSVPQPGGGPQPVLQGLATAGSSEAKEAQVRHMSREPPKLSQQQPRAGEATLPKPAPLQRGPGPPVAPAGTAVAATVVAVAATSATASSVDLQQKVVEELQRELEELRRQNTELTQRAELVESDEASCKNAKVAETEELACLVEASEEELSRECTRSRRLALELQEARAQVAADSGAEVKAQLAELRRYVLELEKGNGQQRGTIEGLEEELAEATRAAEAATAEEHRLMGPAAGCAEEPPVRERLRMGQLLEDFQQLKAELAEERAKSSESAAAEAEGRSVAASSALESAEVRLLRAELAKRDRELLAAAAARRRTADQSERAAAALRAKLTELEAAVAATPSTSSRASSPRSSERGGPVLVHSMERGVQTELEEVCQETGASESGGRAASVGEEVLSPGWPVPDGHIRRLQKPHSREDLAAWDPERMQETLEPQGEPRSAAGPVWAPAGAAESMAPQPMRRAAAGPAAGAAVAGTGRVVAPTPAPRQPPAVAALAPAEWRRRP